MSNEIVLLSIPKDELETLIINSVNACLKFHLPKQEEAAALPELLTRKQVAEYLSISLTTVDTLARDGILKKHFVGGSPRFKRNEVRTASGTWEKYQHN